MRKIRFLMQYTLLPALFLSMASCQDSISKEGFSVSFADGMVVYSYPMKDSSKYSVYRSDSADGNYELVEKDVRDVYKTDDVSSYFIFESDSTKERTKPYSYLHSSFSSDAVRVVSSDEDKEKLQTEIDHIYNRMEWDEFSPERYAYLFMPGDYSSIEEKVGYYTTVSGLGYTPDDVKLKTVTRYDSPLTSGALCNFWCGVENVSTSQSVDFYVSQATYLRRMHVKGDITLSSSGYSSGGFLANSRIDGEIKNSTQQQYLFRNDEWKEYTGKVDINMVYSGIKGSMNYSWPDKRVTLLDKTGLMKEKPFLVFDEDKGFGLFEPDVQKETKGVSWSEKEDGTFHPLSEFYIAHSDKDDAYSLNKVLEEGKNIIFTPGTYLLDSPIQVKKEDTILYGMGMATLHSTQKNTDAILKTEDVSGLIISDLLLEAGSVMENMMSIGKEGDDNKHTDNPSLLSDLFFRLGGNANVTTGCDTALVIHSNDVIGDNFWLWRADHGMDRDVLEEYVRDDGSLPSNIGSLTNYSYWKGLGVGWKDQAINNYATHGAIINGDDVTLYGLMCEHFGEYQTIWNGERGTLVFYQSETPYDCPNQDAWKKGEQEQDQGYASYKVSDDVSQHTAYGIGVYYVHNDTNEKIVMDHAIEAPANEGIHLEHMAIANFKGNQGCGIRYILNGYGQGNIAPYKAQKTSLTSFIDGKVTL